MSDYRMVSKQIDDYQLEDEAFLSQSGGYLIISYRNKTEYILEDNKQRKQIHVYRTVDTDYLEKGFVVLSFFEGAIVASISEEGHYVVLRDIDQNQVIHK